ncbi:MAG: extracellular solute-binding protein, partial [Spirochaetales bacterium]
YLPQVIEEFNSAYENGTDPVTGKRLTSSDKKIFVKGEPGSSGTIHSYIVNAVNGINTSQVSKPTIFSPSVGHWLRLVNYETNREVFKLNEAVPTANAPVVMAIWESRLNLIKAKNPNKAIGWEQLLEVLRSPNGWADYGVRDGSHKKIYYGHTDPFVSSTALSTLIAEYFASAKYLANKEDLEQLTMENVKDEKIQEQVKQIEKLIKHYSSRTTEFKEYIAQGPNYLDFVALEENDLIYINQGKTAYKPPEKLVALYPKEGTYVHEHPFAVPYTDWVTDEQREAAKKFTDYVLTEKVQRLVMENGFRPANTSITLADPISMNNGVDPSEPRAILPIPAPETIMTIQQNWHFVKKRGLVYVLLDTSGSMDGQKLDNAKSAIQVFAEKMPTENQVGMIGFSNQVDEITPIDLLETNKSRLLLGLTEIYAEGGTAMYDGLLKTIDIMNERKDADTIRAIVMLSDGKDNRSKSSLYDVVNVLEQLQQSDNPIMVVPVAYGNDADISALNAIARASSTKVQVGDTGDIGKLLEVISSYF